MDAPPDLTTDRASTGRYRVLWRIALAINILVAILGIPYSLGFAALGLAEQVDACYAGDLINIISFTPLLIVLASIPAFVISWRFRSASRYTRALLLAFFPMIGFALHFVIFRLSPCWT